MSRPSSERPSRSAVAGWFERSRPSRSAAWGNLLVAIIALALGLTLYGLFAPDNFSIVAVELSGRSQPFPLPAGTAKALWWDFAFIAGYGTALLLGIRALIWTALPSRRGMSYLILACVVVTVVADCLENVCLLLVCQAGGRPHWSRDLLAEAASTAATIKFATLLPAAVGALIGLVAILGRLLRNEDGEASEDPVSAESSGNSGSGTSTKLSKEEPDYLLPWPVEGDPPARSDLPEAGRPDAATRWRNGYQVPGLADTDRLRQQGQPVIGICLSGGGIRAACVSLGALQSLRTELMAAQFMVSVSGSGYTTGAFQQAITDAGTVGPDNRERLGGQALHDPATVFALGGVEEDHVRRHSSYLADTAPRMLLALAMIVRHLLLTLTLLFAPAVVLGIFGGWFYASMPVTDLSMLDVRAHQSSHSTPYPHLRLAAMVALGLTALVALLFWLSSEHAAARGHQHGWQDRRLARARYARQSLLIAAVIATITVVVPSLAWGAAWLLDRADGVEPVAIGGSVGSILFTYLASLGALFWRKKKTIGGEVSGLFGQKKTGGISSAVPTGALQLLLVVVAVLVLTLGWLLLFAGLILTGGDRAALWVGLGVAVLVVVLGGFVDETTLSLHPFYRARLASAFAVRAIRRDEDHQVVAAAYPAPERSTLAEYGAQPPANFPRVIFAATANLTGEERTPPGLNAVSYTFSGDWVGGPDVGWVRTSKLQELAPARFKRDLTVQGAVAISGAAIASAMGKGGRWTQLLMTITGARLGAWMPNPRFVIGTMIEPASWDRQRLPRVRRLSYLLRELFDIHHHDDPLLQVTDGGHYENLGLVELFRRRATRIYCIDSSGDSPPTATTLAQALTLAKQELGVEVTLDSPWPIEPGAGIPLEPHEPLGAFNARLSATPIITGTFRYPPESGAGDVVGHLVVAKAMLWPELSYPVLSYAAKNSVFPHDSTADQWFDDGQYAAYTELGRQLGTLASTAMPTLLAQPGVPVPVAPAPAPAPTPTPTPTPTPVDQQ